MLRRLKRSLATSHAANRREWAEQIVEDDVAMKSLLELLMRGDKTSQRFMWLIGDICERDPDTVAACLPLLFTVRHEMPFPGMPRSVAKWLLLTNVPATVEKQAIPQLLEWVGDATTSIGCKSYSAKILCNLVNEKRIARSRVRKVLSSQIEHPNRSFAARMQKLFESLSGRQSVEKRV